MCCGSLKGLWFLCKNWIESLVLFCERFLSATVGKFKSWDFREGCFCGFANIFRLPSLLRINGALLPILFVSNTAGDEALIINNRQIAEENRDIVFLIQFCRVECTLEKYRLFFNVSWGYKNLSTVNGNMQHHQFNANFFLRLKIFGRTKLRLYNTSSSSLCSRELFAFFSTVYKIYFSLASRVKKPIYLTLSFFNKGKYLILFLF